MEEIMMNPTDFPNAATADSNLLLLLLNNISSTNATLNATVRSPLSDTADKALSLVMAAILFVTMVSLGCTMEISKIKAHMRRPKGVGIAAAAQYGVMPLTAFSLAKLLGMPPMEAVTLLICGCCPGGNLSNILTLALDGDMNLSIVMTACSTLLALGMMPLLLFLYCQGFSGLENAVPYGGISLALLMTLLPCAIGVYINHRTPQYSKLITKIGLSIMLLASVVIGVLASITVGETILAAVSYRLIIAASLMPIIGYTFGYVLSYLFRLNAPCRRTIAMETGCQNIQLCSTILKVAFPPETIGPLFLFPVVYIIFQVAEALVVILAFRCHQRLASPNKKEHMEYCEVESPTTTTEKCQSP
ncbi:hepatic sodium/bile acid cotransporter [Engraulis encrasicolus]|uniref:hepatic sodium/bile acid cotransporter n=1 Tax=Engraulis encrasicolus TaxID=184585 RepID=UPI002FD62E97